MRVAVIGSGAIGVVVAGAAAAAGHDVTVCVRTPVSSLTVDDSPVPARILSDPSGLTGAEVTLLTTKAVDTASAAPWLARAGGPVVVVQNGLDHAARVAPFLPAGAEAVPALAYIGAERLGPGRVRRYLGDLVLVPSARSALVAAALTPGLTVQGRDDWVTACWEKLLGNVIANPLTALTMRRIDVMAEEGMAALARSVLREAIAVGRADGADVSDELVDLLVVGTARYGEGVGSSMLYDRLAGRPLEHQYITGEVVRRGARHGVEVPLNAALLALLDALDRSSPA